MEIVFAKAIALAAALCFALLSYRCGYLWALGAPAGADFALKFRFYRAYVAWFCVLLIFAVGSLYWAQLAAGVGGALTAFACGWAKPPSTVGPRS